MKKIPLVVLCSALAFGGASAFVSAQTPAELSQQLEDKQQEAKYVEQEISFAQLRRKSSQKKLKAYENDLKQKQHELKNAQARYAASPTLENEQFLRNAEQRIELAELSIKSRVASVVRLETKERELAQKLSALTDELASLKDTYNKERLEQKVEQKTQSLKSEMAVQSELLQRRIETLQRENDRLRQVTLAETEKREQAEERATLALERAQAAELALAQTSSSSGNLAEDIDVTEDNLNARERAQAEMARVRAKLASGDVTTGSGVNLFLRGDDGTEYGMFQYLGAQQYRADAVIHQSTSRFRVAGRTYQVKISDGGLGAEFIFLYDMSNPEEPRFVTFKKALLESAGGVVAAD